MFRNSSNAKMTVKNKEYNLVSNSVTEQGYLKHVLKDDDDTFFLSGSVFDKVQTTFSYSNAVKIRNWLTEMIDFAEENKIVKKESAAVSKEYSFGEMIDEYAKGYEGQFKQLDEKERVITKGAVYVFYKGGCALCLSDYNIKAKYIKVDKEVPIHEAIKALKEGKAIYFTNDRGSRYSFNNIPECEEYAMTVKDLTTRKWYISE